MSPKDIRWRQRFTNFEKAVGALERTIQIRFPRRNGVA